MIKGLIPLFKMQKIWQIRKCLPELQKKFTQNLSVHPVVAQLLINREITSLKEAEQFLFPDYQRRVEVYEDGVVFTNTDAFFLIANVWGGPIQNLSQLATLTHWQIP